MVEMAILRLAVAASLIKFSAALNNLFVVE
jgi:hypothetical protein